MKSIFPHKKKKKKKKKTRNQRKGEIAILTLFFLPKSLVFGPEDIEAVVIEFETMADTVRFGFEKHTERDFQKP